MSVDKIFDESKWEAAIESKDRPALLTLSVVKLSIFGFDCLKTINVFRNIKNLRDELINEKPWYVNEDPRITESESILKMVTEMTADEFQH